MKVQMTVEVDPQTDDSQFFSDLISGNGGFAWASAAELSFTGPGMEAPLKRDASWLLRASVSLSP